MIHVDPAPEPPDFDRRVRQPGLSAIAELVGEPPLSRRRGPRRSKIAVQREDIPPDRFPPFWRNGLDDMMLAYNQICAYMAVYIEKVTGAATVDHMIPRSVEWNQVYEWANYRLACSLMNSRKSDAVFVLDPFQVKSGWFELELVSFQVKPAAKLPSLIRDRVEKTITRLRLNARECRELRGNYVMDYETKQISLAHLTRRAPFIAIELRRQGRLQERDKSPR
jgi:hypothetical protein